ncbi:S-adenosyl-L-methionine-dependent methyltransferase [Biscogniauxia sp. FL1348]|nr:S-adenosyl-L-methionine-dependent methyltransferase [Biscogniauxia sp. FL1348]
MVSSSRAPSRASQLSSIVASLEALLPTNSTGHPEDICEDGELRKRLISVIRRLVPELETPADTSQRILYDVFELTAARIGVDLNIFSILCSAGPGPLSTAELAQRTSARDPDPALLARILRYMASVGLVREAGAGLWAASNYGRNLVGEGYRAGVCHVHDNVLPAYAALPAFLRRHAYRVPRDDTAFALGHGQEGTAFFDWLRARPDNARYFHGFMGAHRTAARTWLERADVVERVVRAYEVMEKIGAERGRAVFVDVGGGVGQQCNALKKRCPDLKGRIVLEDLEEVVAEAELEEGVDKVGVSFFDEQPVKGAAAYYLRSVLRDWPDSSCQKILQNISDAMDDAHSVLLIDELVVPDKGAHRLETQLDMTMLAMLNGEARSYSHWKELLAASGFVIEDVAYYEEEAREAVIVAKKAITATTSPQ